MIFKFWYLLDFSRRGLGICIFLLIKIKENLKKVVVIIVVGKSG